MRAFPYSMMAHSASTCQCSSRTPPAVNRISTPAMSFDIGRSRTVTWRVHPPLSIRFLDSANEYLNGFTLPLSVEGGQTESGFSWASGRFLGPGSVSFGTLWFPPCCAMDPSVRLAASCPVWAAAETPAVAASATGATPSIFRRLRRMRSVSWLPTSLDNVCPSTLGIFRD